MLDEITAALGKEPLPYLDEMPDRRVADPEFDEAKKTWLKGTEFVVEMVTTLKAKRKKP